MNKFTVFYVSLITVALVGSLVGSLLTNHDQAQDGFSGWWVETYTVHDVFKLSIWLEKSEFCMGETIPMNIRLTNIGEENASITFNHIPNPSQYWFWKVYDESNQTVFYHKEIISIPSRENVTLKPDQCMQRNCTWNQKATDNEQQVPAGKYYLTARVGFHYRNSDVLFETRAEVIIKSA